MLPVPRVVENGQTPLFRGKRLELLVDPYLGYANLNTFYKILLATNKFNDHFLLMRRALAKSIQIFHDIYKDPHINCPKVR